MVEYEPGFGLERGRFYLLYQQQERAICCQFEAAVLRGDLVVGVEVVGEEACGQGEGHFARQVHYGIVDERLHIELLVILALSEMAGQIGPEFGLWYVISTACRRIFDLVISNFCIL